MGKKGKKFIDRRRDALHTFKVVARSQRDPLVADENAPQAVLHSTDPEKKKELEKYGIYFDDDYNYLQHLRGMREAVNWNEEELEVYTIRKEDPQANKKELRKQRLVLPSSAFESFVEEPIGLLNKAAPVTGPRPELDPDVVAGLDEDLIDELACNPDDEDALPDNFVVMLNSEEPIHEFDDDDEEWEDCDDDDDDDDVNDGRQYMPCFSKLSAYREKRNEEGYDADEEEHDFSSDFNDSDDEERDELCSLDGGPSKTFREAETMSHFTSYSLSSSVLTRNDNLSVLDDCFEEKFIREYQDEQVGALDGEDIEGFIGEESPLFQQVLEQAKKQFQAEPEDERTRIINWIKDMEHRIDHDKNEKEQIEVSEDEPGEKWDCETILSTYSTQYNHPRTITDPPRRKKIAVNPRTGIPIEHGVEGLTRKAVAQHDKEINMDNEKAPLDTETLLTSMSAISIRPVGESSEERRYRKKALKELRRERRNEKKLNRTAFKDEKKRLEKINMNNRYNNKISLV